MFKGVLSVGRLLSQWYKNERNKYMINVNRENRNKDKHELLRSSEKLLKQ